MAKATPELKRVVKCYRTQLEKTGIRSTRVLLYGSQATGTAREGSDIDLIVISGDWKKYNHRERGGIAPVLWADVDAVYS